MVVSWLQGWGSLGVQVPSPPVLLLPGSHLAVSCHVPPRSGHLLGTALVSPGCLEDIRSGTVMVLQCPRVWDSYPEERERLVFVT